MNKFTRILNSMYAKSNVKYHIIKEAKQFPVCADYLTEQYGVSSVQTRISEIQDETGFTFIKTKGRVAGRKSPVTFYSLP
jgi:hypothetical protein